MAVTTLHADDLSTDTLSRLGKALRLRSIRLADEAGSGHPTSSMSAADLVAVLIAGHLRIDPADPDRRGNDRLVFSKGHASPLLYSALEVLGIVEVDGYRTDGSVFEGHPTPRVPGVSVATGSLGLGLPMAVGMALAARLEGIESRIWTLCGDGELAEGSMWEAIEHAGWAQLANLVAVVDVNRLGQRGPTRHGWDLDVYRRRFADAGWRALVVDGHDVADIDHAYRTACASEMPTAVIAHTVKGSGATETEDRLGKHGKPLDDPDAARREIGGSEAIRVAPRSPETHGPLAAPSSWPAVDLPRWEVGDMVATRDAFGAAMVALGAARGDVVAFDGEVADSTRLAAFAEAHPDRFFEMFIAEQLMAAAAIGMQVTGWRPVLATFGAFLGRAFDVLRMATISRADLCCVGSHAGVSVGADGPSQMALEDVAMMRALHGSTVVQPCDANQTADLLPRLIDRSGVSYLRTLRGETPVVYEPGTAFPIGGSVTLRRSDRDLATIVASGVTVHEALAAADELAEEGIGVRVLDAYSIAPIDGEALLRCAAETGRFVVVEDHRPAGGLGEAVMGAFAGSTGPVVSHLAVRDLPGSGSPDQLRARAGIDAATVAAATRALVS